MRGFPHYYNKDIYGIRPVVRELHNTVVWLGCGSDLPPSGDAVDCFLTDLKHVIDEVSDRLVKQAACCGLLDLTYCIDSIDVGDARRSRRFEVLRSNRRRVLLGYGCAIVSTSQKIPIAAEFTESKQAPSPRRSGWSVTVPTIRSSGTTTCWPRGSCQSLRATHETPTTRETSV